MERSMEGAVGTFYGGGSGNVLWREQWERSMEGAVGTFYGGACENVLWRGL